MHLVQHIHGKNDLYFINTIYLGNWLYIGIEENSIIKDFLTQNLF